MISQIKSVIPQIANSCWFNACLNMVTLIPNLQFIKPELTNMMKLQRNVRTNGQLDLGTRVIRNLLTELHMESSQYEAYEGMKILNKYL